MTEEQLLQILQAFKSGIEQITERVDSLSQEFNAAREKLDKLETTVFDEIINPANDYIAEADKNARFEEFNSKYGEKFGDFAEPLKALEGDDYDVVREAFNQYDDFEGEKPEEDAYVEALVGELANKLGQIKSSLGIPEDTEIAVEETEDGGAVVTTEDGEVVASTEGEAAEEPEVEDEVEITDEDGEAEDDPEEVAAFEEELKNYKD